MYVKKKAWSLLTYYVAFNWGKIIECTRHQDPIFEDNTSKIKREFLAMMLSLLTIPKSALCLIQIKASLNATREDVTSIAQLCCFGDIRFHILLLGRNDIASVSSRKFSSFRSDLSFRG
jgi:hypothetical protein